MISLALAATLALGAPDPEDDLALAVALARRGWIELAEGLCEKVEHDRGASPAARSHLRMARAEVAVEKARREPRVAEAARGLEVAIETLRAEPKPDLEARTLVGWMLGEKARILGQAAELEEDPEARGPEALDAARAWGAVEEFERALLEELRKLPSTAEVEQALLEARMELPRALLSHAKVPGIEPGLRRALLKQAVDGFVDVQFDALPPYSWDAQLDEGRCHTELGDIPKAQSRLQGVLDLRKLLPRKAVPEELLLRATFALAQAWVAGEKGKEAVDLVDGALKQNPGLGKTGFGFALLLEKASALHGQKNVEAALALALKVEGVDPEGSLGRMARLRIRQWVTHGAGSPRLWMTLAEAEIAQGRFRDASKTLRRSIETCRTAAEKSTFEPVALYKEAECQRSLRREAEAIQLFVMVYRRWPAHELAARAGIEAARGLARQAALSGDRRDEEELEGVLVEVEKMGPGVDAVRFLHAERCEDKRQFQRAAELYAGVGESSEYYAQALISSAHCWRLEASGKGKEEGVSDLGRAEETLRRFLAWSSGRPVGSKARGVAWRELAAVLAHPEIGKFEEALECLRKKEVKEGQDVDGRLRSRELEVTVALAQKKWDAATEALDAMLKEKPEAPATLRSCRKVFLTMGEAARPVGEAKVDGPLSRELAGKAGIYASRWVALASAQGPPATSDLVEAADTLYHSARRLNDLGDDVISFADLEGRKVAHPELWVESARAHRLLLSAPTGDLSPKDRLVAHSRLARSLGFAANDAKSWELAKAEYVSIMTEYKVEDARGQLDPAVLQARTSLFPLYLEMGDVYAELGRRGQRFQFDNSFSVFGKALRILSPDSRSWWRTKYLLIEYLFERGTGSDVRDAKILIENLERNNPEFDAGRFGMKDKFLELRDRIRKLAGP